MTTQTEALKLALEALEVAEHFLEEYAASKYYFAHVAAITAIKEALAQPEHHTLTSRVNDVRLHKERDEQRAEAMKMLAQPEQCTYPDCNYPCMNLPDCKKPEQEPVAWLSEGGNFSFVPYKCSTPLYTTPLQRTWVGLTDEEIWQTVTDCTIGGDLHADKFAKAIEAKLRSKNNG